MVSQAFNKFLLWIKFKRKNSNYLSKIKFAIQMKVDGKIQIGLNLFNVYQHIYTSHKHTHGNMKMIKRQLTIDFEELVTMMGLHTK